MDPGPAAEAPAPLRAEGEGWALELRELAPGVWLHTTWRELPGVWPFPANGRLVRQGDALVMVDTAWGEAPTEQLQVWAEDELGLPVTDAGHPSPRRLLRRSPRARAQGGVGAPPPGRHHAGAGPGGGHHRRAGGAVRGGSARLGLAAGVPPGFRPQPGQRVETEAVDALGEDPAVVGAWLAALGATGAERAQVFTLRGDDAGFHGGMGIPLRSELAFRHEQGWLMCACEDGARSPSILQRDLGCAPVAGEAERWWWCPLE